MSQPQPGASGPQSVQAEDGTMVVVYLVKGGTVWLDALVDGTIVSDAGVARSNKNVVAFLGDKPNGKPGFGVRALAVGETTVTIRGESPKTHKKTEQKVRIIVE